MGYSGYTRYLCGKGHLHVRDCTESSLKACTSCGSKLVWSNSVDTTNGSRHQLDLTDEAWEELDKEYTQEEWDNILYCKGCEHCVNGRIDGYVELEQTHPPRVERCSCCSHEQEIEPARFKVPLDRGRAI